MAGSSNRHRDWNLSCKVYIGNLGNSASKYEIEDVFNRYGKLKNVWVARNPPGFAFVEFEDSRDAEDSVKSLDGTRICGSRATVEMSSGKSREDGGRGDRRGRDGGRGGGGYRGRGGGGFGGGRSGDRFREDRGTYRGRDDGGRDGGRRDRSEDGGRRDRSRSPDRGGRGTVRGGRGRSPSETPSENSRDRSNSRDRN